jgi:hypothetical protein
VPPQNRLRRDNRRHLSEGPTSEPVAENSSPSPFVVGEPQSSALQLRPQYAVLLAEVLNQFPLLALEPCGNECDDELQRNHRASLRQSPTGEVFGHHGEEFSADVTSEIQDPNGNVIATGCATSIGRRLE